MDETRTKEVLRQAYAVISLAGTAAMAYKFVKTPTLRQGLRLASSALATTVNVGDVLKGDKWLCEYSN